MISIVGQNEYLNVVDARTGAEAEIETIIANFPDEEIIPMYTLIYQTANAYSNDVKARVRTTDDGDDYVDWRTTGLTGGRLGMLGEFAGGYGGDVAGMMIGDNLQRGKDKIMGGKGQTAYERMSAEQQKQFADQIRNETLMSMGIGPGYLPGVQDQYFV